ncbi:MAG: hypothetical protein E7267_01920 [Lachnospiraceae bacterium]|nr:hypothetical protein [Lachnospiraceae bacterium]
MMNKFVYRRLLIPVIVVLLLFTYNTASANADINAYPVNFKNADFTRDASKLMYSEKNGIYFYSFTDIRTKGKKFHKNSINGSKIKSKKLFRKLGSLPVFYISGSDNNILLPYIKKDMQHFVCYNLKGKELYHVKCRVPNLIKKGSYIIYDFVSKGNKIYYVADYGTRTKKHGESFYTHIISINKKTGRLLSDKILSSNNVEYDKVLIVGKKIYGLTDNTVFVYSLSGKRLNEYILPEGEKTKSCRVTSDGSIVKDFDFHSIFVKGKNIYYVNRNGIYRLNTSENSEFQLFYDAKNDKYFSDCSLVYGIREIYIVNDKEFYISFNNTYDYESDVPVVILKYLSDK